MKKLLSILLCAAVLLGLFGCAPEKLPESSGEGSSKPQSSAPAESESVSNTTLTEPGGYPHREPVFHDWDGSDVLFPYGVFADPWLGVPFGFEQGMLIPSNSYLNYLDFASGQLVKFCFRPNCQHYGADCDALVSNSSTWCFVANDKFYYLDTAHTTAAYNEDLEAYTAQADLYVSSLNRSNEKKIATIPVQSTRGNASVFLVLYGNSAFLFHKVARRDTMVSQDETPEDAYSCVYLTEIGLQDDTVVNSQIIYTGYGCNVTPQCAYGGGIYLTADRYEEPTPAVGTVQKGNETLYIIDGGEYTSEGLERYMYELSVREYFRYDIETGEWEKRTDAFPDEYGGSLVDYIVGFSDQPQGIRPLAMVNDWCVANDGTLKAYNLRTGEVQTILETAPLNGSEMWIKAVPTSEKITLHFSDADILEVTAVDLNTGEQVKLPYLSDGQDRIRVEEIFHWTEDAMYAYGSRLEMLNGGYHGGSSVYLRIDLTNGFEANQWEEFTLS